jgi:effector-binding domain-containing protein
MTKRIDEPPRIVEREEQACVGIRTRATLREWSTVNALLRELLEWSSEVGVHPPVAPFYRYRVIGDEDRPYDVEVGIPIHEMPAESGRGIRGSIPGGRYVRLVHCGHPDRLDESHARLRAWAEEEGVELRKELKDGVETWDGLFEFYLTDPAVEPDPDNWTIEVLCRVR